MVKRHGRCVAITQNGPNAGRRCKRRATAGNSRCPLHNVTRARCTLILITGNQCKNTVNPSAAAQVGPPARCGRHVGFAAPAIPPAPPPSDHGNDGNQNGDNDDEDDNDDGDGEGDNEGDDDAEGGDRNGDGDQSPDAPIVNSSVGQPRHPRNIVDDSDDEADDSDDAEPSTPDGRNPRSFKREPPGSSSNSSANSKLQEVSPRTTGTRARSRLSSPSPVAPRVLVSPDPVSPRASQAAPATGGPGLSRTTGTRRGRR